MYREVNLHKVFSIVFVHGLHGHPYSTWASTQKPAGTTTQPAVESVGEKHILRNPLRRIASWLGRDENKGTSESCTAFWPVDLLPEECPNSRILLFGYDSKAIKFGTGALNKGSTFTHGKDLLFTLSRKRDANRPLIFVGHSLGGIVIKEVNKDSANQLCAPTDPLFLANYSVF